MRHKAPFGGGRVGAEETVRETQQVSLGAVLRIRIHMFLGLLDPDPDLLVRGTDPDPPII
jgi:hypothetical protein